MPGGGTIVLGLDEQDGFRATGVYEPVEAQRRLADQARTAVTPPLQVTLETALTEGATLVVARVSELPARDKPCSVIAGGRAYLRSYDGDYALSAQEQAAFVAERGPPRFDRDAVSDTGLDDLDRAGGSARNQSLYDIAKDIRTPDGRRIIEGIGTGITAAREALHAAGMTPPHFLDAGVRFTAIVPRHALLDPDDLQWLAALPGTSGASDAQRHALVDMRHGVQFTNLTYRERFPMDSTQARAQLSDLVERGVVEARGEKRGRTYRLDPQAAVPLSLNPPVG